MTKSNRETFRAEAAALAARIRSLLDDASLEQMEEELSPEEVTHELIAEYGSEDAANVAVNELLTSLWGGSPANDAAPESRNPGQTPPASGEHAALAEERFMDMAAFAGPRGPLRAAPAGREDRAARDDVLGSLTFGGAKAVLFRRDDRVFLRAPERAGLSLLGLGHTDYQLVTVAGTPHEFAIADLSPKAARQFAVSHEQEAERFPARWS